MKINGLWIIIGDLDVFYGSCGSPSEIMKDWLSLGQFKFDSGAETWMTKGYLSMGQSVVDVLFDILMVLILPVKSAFVIMRLKFKIPI